MKYLILFVTILALHFQTSAQVEPMSVDGRASGNWAYTLKGIKSSFSNQAGLSTLSGFSAAIYAEQTHLLSEFSNVGLAVGYSTGANSGISANFSSYGIEEFRQNRIGLGYGMALSRELSIGIQIDWYQTSITNYGQNSQLSFRVGGIYRIFDDLTAGMHFSNPMGIEIADNHPIPSEFNFDLAWRISSQLIIGAGFVKDVDQDGGFKGAIRYQIHPNFRIMLGALTEPAKFTFGISIALNDFSIQSAASYHQQLGFSPSAGLVYESN